MGVRNKRKKHLVTHRGKIQGTGTIHSSPLSTDNIGPCRGGEGNSEKWRNRERIRRLKE